MRMGGSRGGGGQSVRTPTPVNFQVAICFLRHTGTDPLEKQLDPSGPTASWGRSVSTSVKYVDD